MIVIVVVRCVVSAAGSPQMQMSVPSDCIPDGPKAGSLSGVSPSWASTSSDRIARQSDGSCVSTVGVALGVLVGSADDVCAEASEVELGVAPGSGAQATRMRQDQGEGCRCARALQSSV